MPEAQKPLVVLSLGAGVQSTTLALMAAHGEFNHMPDCAIFADTGWEPKAVYDHLKWLSSPNVLPFPVHIVSAGNIREGVMAGADGKRWASLPAFAVGDDGRGSPIRRQCTKEYKIVPIRRKVRELVGIAGKRSPKEQVIEQWIGISLDEVIRMKPSGEEWQVNRWPLIEKRMSRSDCLLWMERHGYPTPPKSSCIGCPFHSDEMWRDIRDRAPEEWQDAVAVDAAIRNGFRGMRKELFLHRSLVPLDQVDLSTHDERGQPDLFMNDCEGMCGN